MNMTMQFTKNDQTTWPAEAALDLDKSWLLSREEEPVAIEPQRPKKGFQLDELYRHLDCDTVEVVRLGESGLILIIDEEGKLKDEGRVNMGATYIWWELVEHAWGQDVIVGKAIICKTELFK